QQDRSMAPGSRSSGAGRPPRRGAPRLRAGDAVVVRCPLLPMSLLATWAEQGGGAVPRLRAALGAIATAPEVREAIALSWPELDAALERWLADPGSARGRRAERALVRAISRMAGRPTPLGMAASVAVVPVGRETSLEVAPAAGCRRRARLDAELLGELAARLGGEPAVRARLRFEPNPTVRRAAGHLRFARLERRPGGIERRSRAVELPAEPWIERAPR